MGRRQFDVELTQGAENDLEEIYDHLVENASSEVANQLLESFLEAIQTLEQFPLRGNIPNELQSLGIREFRQLLLLPYRLIYRVGANKVFVMVVADGRRDMQTLLERRLLGRST